MQVSHSFFTRVVLVSECLSPRQAVSILRGVYRDAYGAEFAANCRLGIPGSNCNSQNEDELLNELISCSYCVEDRARLFVADVGRFTYVFFPESLRESDYGLLDSTYVVALND